MKIGQKMSKMVEDGSKKVQKCLKWVKKGPNIKNRSKKIQKCQKWFKKGLKMSRMGQKMSKKVKKQIKKW